MGRGLLTHFLKRLRIFTTSLSAAASALFNIARHRDDSQRIDLVPGDEAPDFELMASDGRTYRLSEFSGRQGVVIAWFPKAFTGGCTAECESIGANSHALARFNVAYFGASVDTPDTNRRFAQSLGLTFPILSDPQKSVARAYGVLNASGFPARWTFYIGLDRRILVIDKQVRWGTAGADIEKLLTDLQGANPGVRLTS